MQAKQALSLFFIVLITAAIVGCGKDVCILGMGESCSAPKIDQDNQPHVSSTLNLTADAAIIKINQRATFTASGGTKPYEFKLYQGSGWLVKDTETENSIEFQAPNIETTASVRVYDAKGTYKTYSITVEQ